MSERAATTDAKSASKTSLNRIPGATYRLQLGSDFRLDNVIEYLPYLVQLGVTDLYLSPLFRARAESNHGYDVVDHGTIDPAIGDLDAFARLSEKTSAADMGILLDVVPNHMGVNDPSNKWWLDVLENGKASYFADYFDIEWHPPAAGLENKLLLPFLQAPFGQILERGELKLVSTGDGFAIECNDRQFPLCPGTWPLVLRRMLSHEEPDGSQAALNDNDRDELDSIALQLERLPNNPTGVAIHDRYREQKIAKRRLQQLLSSSPGARQLLEQTIVELNGDPDHPRSLDALEEILAEQWYRFAYWRVAADDINYRRFFDVNDLAAIRVEDPRVFDAVHRLVGKLLEPGWVTGLRIDHPDGLLDPFAYFKRLQSFYHSTHPDRRSTKLYVLAEKILSSSEDLASDWPVEGTTGYDVLNVFSWLLVHAQGLKELREQYAIFTRQDKTAAEVAYESRRAVLLSTMASELQMLSAQLSRIARQHRAARDYTQLALQRALREVLASLTVYRTYVRGDSWDVADNDYRNVMLAVRMAKRRNRNMPHEIFDYIASVLLLEQPPTLSREQADERRKFVLKFQQVSGPVAAKGIEDTAFYRYYPLASLNEVGGDLDASPIGIEEFHRLMQHRQRDWPHSMNATSTHDSKRGEDHRTRLHVLSEAPSEWFAAFDRWRSMNEKFRTELDGNLVPDANEEYLLYQTLIGTWPLDGLSAGRPEYENRIKQYMQKALREAKVHTSWMSPWDQYEQAIDNFITSILAKENVGFTADVTRFVSDICDAGFVNSLAQLALKLTVPGVPDFYRGTELWDFNLVDPDNRRPVDYETRRAIASRLNAGQEKGLGELVSNLVQRWPDPEIKLWITMRGLRLRRKFSDLFAHGEYVPLTVTGALADHIVAFARHTPAASAISVVPRHVYRLTKPLRDGTTGNQRWSARWEDTSIELPPGWPTAWQCYLSGSTANAQALDHGRNETESPGRLLVGELLRHLPIALCVPKTLSD